MAVDTEVEVEGADTEEATVVEGGKEANIQLAFVFRRSCFVVIHV